MQRSHRQDIDGLRAVAVLLVVVFHAFPNLLRGGFIGVDIFFVISGYLITTIILDGLRDGAFSFKEFYTRRINRIVPSLLTVLLFTAALGGIALYPLEYAELGQHIMGGASFTSNFILRGEAGYFDTAAHTKPLLHLWSLAIEEQFYIFWPFALWLVCKYRAGTQALLILFFCASIAASFYAAEATNTTAFYSPLTRFWELLVGATLSYLQHTRTRREIPHAGSCSGAGVVLIVLGLLLITEDRAYPGLWALLPTVGTALVIYGGERAPFNATVLSRPAMAWFGRISYPLYLWHWPLLSFATIIENETPSRLVRLAIVLVSVALAAITYRVVETPIRANQSNRRTALVLVTALAATGGLGAALLMSGGASFRTQYLKSQHPLDGLTMQMHNYAYQPQFAHLFAGVEPIQKRDFLLLSATASNSPLIVIAGDSHANRLYVGLAQVSNRSLLNIGRGTCPPFIDTDVVTKTGESFLCQPFVNNYLRHLRDKKDISVVIINAYYAQYNRDFLLVDTARNGAAIELSDAMARTVSYLRESGKMVVVALGVPEVPSTCYARGFPIWHTGRDIAMDCTMSKRAHEGAGSKLLAGVRVEPGRVVVFDPSSALCEDHACGEIDVENYLYTPDGNHLNALGVRRLGDSLEGFLASQGR